jgi:hypothetical protein
MSEANNSRRSFLANGLKALALLVPAAAVILSGEKTAEARPWRYRGRRRYYR